MAIDVTPAFNAFGIAPVPTARTDRAGKAVHNAMLLAIPDDEFNAIRPLLEPVEMPRYRLIYEKGQRIEQAYFANEGMISLVVVTEDGRSVEIGITGNEGVVGVPVAFGFEFAPTRAISQLPGNGVQVTPGALAETFPRCPTLLQLIERYVLTQQLQVSQIAACNRLHDMEQRLARWLLMCQDRVSSEFLPLTHEFLAQMLGVGRPTVTIAAGALERAGLIENTRGNVKIVNRKRLEDAACECYGAIQNFSGALALT